MSKRPAQEYLSLNCSIDGTTEGTTVVGPGRKQAGWGRDRNADLRSKSKEGRLELLCDTGGQVEGH